MLSSTQPLSAMAPWRRTAMIALLIVAVAMFGLIVTNVASTAATIGAVMVVVLSLLIGPRSPFFKSDPA